MGIYVNPGNKGFWESVHSEIYVDKTGLIANTNKYINTEQKFICVSRPRRFGKSMAADMLSAYYSKGCDSRELFADLDVSKQHKTVSDMDRETRRMNAYKSNLNQHNVIRFDVQRFLFDESHIPVFIKRIQDVIIRELEAEFEEYVDLCTGFIWITRSVRADLRPYGRGRHC